MGRGRSLYSAAALLVVGCTTRAEDRVDAAVSDAKIGAPRAPAHDASVSQGSPPPAATDLSPAPCPEGMVFISGGTFTMGLSPGGLKDMPEYARWNAPHKVTLTRPYCIDRTEVTVAAYRKCVAAGACLRNHCNAQHDALVEHPMNCVNWTEADGYCRWANKRLPTEAEWEFAAKGPKSFRHPWGNSKPDDTKLWWSGTKRRDFHTAPVATHPKGASPFGVLDMEGNVGEWVADWFAKHPVEPQVDPVGPPSGTEKVLKHLSLESGLYVNDLGERLGFEPGGRREFENGFRCALTPTTPVRSDPNGLPRR